VFFCPKSIPFVFLAVFGSGLRTERLFGTIHILSFADLIGESMGVFLPKMRSVRVFGDIPAWITYL
jgi:hypothetical protein